MTSLQEVMAVKDLKTTSAQAAGTWETLALDITVMADA